MAQSTPFSGTVALVTGGSRGIGAAIVRRLARDGVDIALTYSSSPDKAEKVAEAVRAEGRRALVLQADSGDPSALVDAVARVKSELGRLDILVNSAGIATTTPMGEIPVAEFDRLVAVNVRGVFLASQAAANCFCASSR